VPVEFDGREEQKIGSLKIEEDASSGINTCAGDGNA
jgi:hypothetical protein